MRVSVHALLSPAVLRRRCFSFLSSDKRTHAMCSGVAMTVWPSGLRRWLQAPGRKGVGSNPTAVILHDAADVAGPKLRQHRRSLSDLATAGFSNTALRQKLLQQTAVCSAGTMCLHILARRCIAFPLRSRLFVGCSPCLATPLPFNLVEVRQNNQQSTSSSG